jgi:hypothetical protein
MKRPDLKRVIRLLIALLSLTPETADIAAFNSVMPTSIVDSFSRLECLKRYPTTLSLSSVALFFPIASCSSSVLSSLILLPLILSKCMCVCAAVTSGIFLYGLIMDIPNQTSSYGTIFLSYNSPKYPLC